MKDQALSYAKRAWGSFQSFSPGQKAVSVVALMVLVIGGYVFTRWQAKPAYSPLFTNLSATDASAIIDKLNTNKIPYQLSAGGTEIDVPQSDLYAQRLAISAAGLPSSGSSGYSLLDKEGVTTSDFQQQVDYQRAVEGELDNTIRSIQGINAASVHLAIPQNNVFNDGTVKTTASVLLTLQTGTSLSGEQVQSIVNLVANSVPGLSADDVTVSDATGKQLSSGDGTDSSTSTDTQSSATKAYNSQIDSQLQALLDTVVGAGHSSVIANATLDFDKSSSTAKTYTYTPNTPPISETNSSEVYSGATTNAGGGILGSGGTSNPAGYNYISPAASAASGSANASGNAGYSKTSGTSDNAVNQTTTQTTSAPGALTKMNVAVVLDSNVPNINKTAIQNLITSAVGLDPKRGDSLAIESMPFDTSAAKQAAQENAGIGAANKAAAAQKKMQSMIRTGALVLLVAIVLIGTWFSSRRRRKAAERLAAEQAEYGQYEARDDMDELIEQLQAEPRHQVIRENPPPVHNAQAEDLAEQRRVLVTLAENQPQDVARVMQNWLNSNN